MYTLVFKAFNYLIEKDLLPILIVGKLWKLFGRKPLAPAVFEIIGRGRWGGMGMSVLESVAIGLQAQV